MNWFNLIASLVILATSIFWLIGCDEPKAASTGDSIKERFELRQDNKGQVIRLDKVTGEIAIVPPNRAKTSRLPDRESRGARVIGVVPLQKELPRNGRGITGPSSASQSFTRLGMTASTQQSQKPIDLSVPIHRDRTGKNSLEPEDLSVPLQGKPTVNPFLPSSREESGSTRSARAPGDASGSSFTAATVEQPVEVS